MLIGTWDISKADARQWKVTPGFHAVSNDSEWVRGSPVPAMFKNNIGFKPLTVMLLIKADGRQNILDRCSRILSHLLEPVELTLDGFKHKFYGVLKKHSHSENVIRRWHTLSLEFEVYEFGSEVLQDFSGQTEMAVTNPGNIPTPAIIEITPQAGKASVTLTGICRDENTGADLLVVIRDLETGKKIILDGETGLITQDGILKTGVEIWGMPSLLPGENIITVDNEWMDIAVRFHPRFM